MNQQKSASEKQSGSDSEENEKGANDSILDEHNRIDYDTRADHSVSDTGNDFKWTVLTLLNYQWLFKHRNMLFFQLKRH